MDLKLTTSRVGGAAVLTAAGEIDVFTAKALEEGLDELLDAGPGLVVVDLSGVSFLDSTGLGVLVRALKRAGQSGGSLRAVVVGDRIRRIFEITGLDAALPLFDTVAAALAG